MYTKTLHSTCVEGEKRRLKIPGWHSNARWLNLQCRRCAAGPGMTWILHGWCNERHHARSSLAPLLPRSVCCFIKRPGHLITIENNTTDRRWLAFSLSLPFPLYLCLPGCVAFSPCASKGKFAFWLREINFARRPAAFVCFHRSHIPRPPSLPWRSFAENEKTDAGTAFCPWRRAKFFNIIFVCDAVCVCLSWGRQEILFMCLCVLESGAFGSISQMRPPVQLFVSLFALLPAMSSEPRVVVNKSKTLLFSLIGSFGKLRVKGESTWHL